MQAHSGKILITGAAGFIGSHLVDTLLKRGVARSQLRLVIAPWDSTENLAHHGQLEVHAVDIRDTKQLKKYLTDCSVVYHLAAKIDFDGESYETYKSVNVTPTAALYRYAAAAGVQKFIFFSSIGVHGLPAGIGPMEGWDESHPATYTNWYGQSKWEAEEAIRSLYKKHRLAYGIVRPASVYGPREKGPTLALYRAIYHRQFLLIGAGEHKLHYVYVGDIVAAAHTLACSQRTQGAYIIGGPRPVSLRTVAEQIATACGVSLWPVQLPVWFALPVSWVLEQVFAVLGRKAPLYPERVRTMTTPYYFSLEKARTELGFTPKVDFALGSRITGLWYKTKGWL